MATADAHGDGPLQVALFNGRPDVARAMLDEFPGACEGPWRGARSAASRSLPAALHRLVASAARSPPSSMQKPNYRGVVRLLVEGQSAPVDTRDRHERTPLAAALATGAPRALARELVRHDSALDATDSGGRCPLMHACAAGDAEIAQLILNALSSEAGGVGSGRGGDKARERACAIDRRAQTALMLAAAAKSARAVGLLIEAGAAVEEIDGDGRCAALLAVLPAPRGVGTEGGGSGPASGAVADVLRHLSTLPTACAAALGRRAAEVDAAGTAEALSDEAAAAAGAKVAALMALACDPSSGECALSHAAAAADAMGFGVLCDALEASGVPVGSCAARALASASRDGAVGAVERLLARDTPGKALCKPLAAQPSLAALGLLSAAAASAAPPASFPPSAATGAARGGHAEVLRLLLAHDPSAGSAPAAGDGVSALMVAAAAGSLDCVQLLLASAGGGDVGACDTEGRSVLMYAAAGGSAPCVSAMLAARADPNALDDLGRSPLVHAAAAGDLPAIEALLDAAPAQLNSPDRCGLTPVLAAAAGGHQAAVEALAERGVELDAALDDALRGPRGSCSSSSTVEGGDVADTDTAPGTTAAVPMAPGALGAPALDAWLRAAVTVSRVAGIGLLVWRALRLAAPPALLAGLLRTLEHDGGLRVDAEHSSHGRGLLHTAIAAVADGGSVVDAHALALANGLPHRQLLALDADGLTPIGLAAEAGLNDLAVSLETATFARLQALVEVTCAPSYLEHARRMAAQLHSYWPQLALHVRSPNPKAPPRASSFDVLWVERWGGSRTSTILYWQDAARPDATLPSAREVWRALSLKVDGRIVIDM